MPRGTESKVGTRRTSPNGYLYEKTENRGWVLVHRLVAEEKLGRELRSDEFASFSDGDKTNFDPKNIIVQLRGQTSLRRRLAVIEDRLRELNAERDEIKRRMELRETL